MKGYWLPLLHSHLPFVKHPEYGYFLEEQWLYEAMTEAYIPQLMMMNSLAEDGIDFRMTVSISPPLVEMLSDRHHVGRYTEHLDRLMELAGREVARLRGNRVFQPIARFYVERFREIRSFFTNFLEGDLLKGYRLFRDLGHVEVITSSATHSLLPLLSVNPKAVEVQIKVAVETHTRHFGEPPAGIWLPECAYFDGLDRFLEEEGIGYFFLDSHGLTEGRPEPRYSVYAPVETPNGVTVFARDPHSSRQVWDSSEGYPGDALYREFYRDAGFDLDFEYVRPYISPDGTRVFTGIKYYRVTGRTDAKEPYDPGAARLKALEHAAHFLAERVRQMEGLAPSMDRPPLVVSPYDAELFGHWWFEGPLFLDDLFRMIAEEEALEAVTPSEYLRLHPCSEVISPSPSSWGCNGYYEVWLNSENDWIYRHLHYMADTLEALAARHHDETDPLRERLLNQAARELLLAQSSDWAFLMTTRTAPRYSAKRTREHIANFNRLVDSLSTGQIEREFLEGLEQRNSIFPGLDFRVYGPGKVRPSPS